MIPLGFVSPEIVKLSWWYLLFLFLLKLWSYPDDTSWFCFCWNSEVNLMIPLGFVFAETVKLSWWYLLVLFLLKLWSYPDDTSWFCFCWNCEVILMIPLGFVCWNPDIILLEAIDLALHPSHSNQFLLEGQSVLSCHLEPFYWQPFRCTDMQLL